MNDDPAPSAGLKRKPGARTVLLEGMLVAAIGVVFALVANAISPRGLALARNYFPGGIHRAPVTAATNHWAPATASAHAKMLSPMERLAARLKAQGLQLVDSNRVVPLFRDARYEAELVVFVDARDDRHYQEGHVPGAYQFDHYHPGNHLATVLPVCETAEEIVVYCGGGDCEDSEFAAVTLGNAGVPKTKLFVYGGGFSEWSTNGLPIEIGARKSGNLRNAGK